MNSVRFSSNPPNSEDCCCEFALDLIYAVVAVTEGAVNFRAPGKRGRDGHFGQPDGNRASKALCDSDALRHTTAKEEHVPHLFPFCCIRPFTPRTSCASTPSSSSSLTPTLYAAAWPLLHSHGPPGAYIAADTGAYALAAAWCAPRLSFLRFVCVGCADGRPAGADMHVTPEVFTARVLVTSLNGALHASAGDEGNAAEVKEVTLREVDAAAFASARPLSEELWCNMGTFAHTARMPTCP
ncbi:hypothetical protein DFH11DRAFT_922830 [Phellopilus nigrolimitatus]|nr:hypothetical protein DFH11DRAFT_922830 [Phellopilus nigrolimitatus]